MRVVMRRWYVSLPIIAIGLVVGLQAYSSSEPIYVANAQWVVLEGPQDEVDGVDNPIARANDDRLPAQLLEESVNTPEFRESLDLPPELNARVSGLVDSTWPIMTVKISAATPEGVASVMDAATSRAKAVLNEVQAAAGAPEATRYVLSVAVGMGEANESRADGLFRAGVIVAITLVLAASAAAVWDYLARRRERAARRRAGGRVEAGAHRTV